MTDTASLDVKVTSTGVTKANAELEKLAENAKKAERATDQLDDNTELASKRFALMGAAVGTVAVALGAAFLTKLTTTAATFQTLRASLEVATGSANEASLAFIRIQEFAARTPFSVESATEAFIKLRNFGLDPSERALTAYGNTASAMGKQLNQMIEAVADAATFQFERLKEFGIKAQQQGDKVIFTFRGVQTEVAKDAGKIEEYLIRLGETNFAGQMEKQSATMAGALSNLGDSWDRLFNSISESGIGDAIESTLRKATSALDFTTKGIERLSNETIQAIEDIQDATTQFDELNYNALDPFTLFVSGISKEVEIWARGTTDLELATHKANQVLAEQSRIVKGMSDADVSAMVRSLSVVESEIKTKIKELNAELAAQEKILKEQSNIYARSDALNSIKDIKEELAIVGQQQRVLNTLYGVARDRLVELRPVVEQTFSAAPIEKVSTGLEKLLEGVQQEQEALGKTKDQLFLLNVERDIETARKKLSKDASAETVAAFDREAESIRKVAQAIAQKISVQKEEKEENRQELADREAREESLAQFFEEENQRLIDQETALTEHFEREQEIADWHYKAMVARAQMYGHESFREYENMFASIEAVQNLSWEDQLLTYTGVLQQLTAEGAKHSRKQFELNKAAGIANAIVSTYTGASKALELGPYIGPIMAGLIIANGLAKVNTIRNQQFGGASSGGGGGGGGGAISAGGAGAPPANITAPTTGGQAAQTGPTFIINGNISGTDGQRIFKELKDILGKGDQILIEETTSNGLLLRGKS